MRKKVFTIQTTDNINAAPGQDWELHQWLISVLKGIAYSSRQPENTNGYGRTVQVIVEVLDD